MLPKIGVFVLVVAAVWAMLATRYELVGVSAGHGGVYVFDRMTGAVQFCAPTSCRDVRKVAGEPRGSSKGTLEGWGECLVQKRMNSN